MNSIHEIDLTPKAGKQYWKKCQREWREEFIYFLLVDRFHDDNIRNSAESATRHDGFGNQDQLKKICGGTLKGITNHLDYIHNLGCTAIWLSPVFENNPESYHGYAIQNYLDVDKRFGSKDDLEELVEKAHSLNMRVFLDIVLHHSGDNWYYPNDLPYYYYDGAEFPLAGWRAEDRPIPTELRDPNLYNRKGRMRNYESYPETSQGDFMNLKAFRSDSSLNATRIQNILIQIHCYWIREVDIDGFRLDGVKHMDEMAVSRFCSHIREYAYTLGKRNFFLFGELVGPEEMYNRYLGPKAATSVDDQSVYFGLNSLLDFHLYQILPDVITGKTTPNNLIEHYEWLGKNITGRSEYGGFLVTFLDNHDQVGQAIKHRFGKDAQPEQIIAGACFLLCALGTPCIYYGTEQGFTGSGPSDSSVRETMFSLDNKVTNVLDENSMIYKGISKIADLRKETAALRFGRMYICKLSKDGIYFHFPDSKNSIIAFSRVLHDHELVIAYNISSTEIQEEFVTVGPKGKDEFRFIFGDTGKIEVKTNAEENKHFIPLKLNPMQFVILSN